MGATLISRRRLLAFAGGGAVLAGTGYLATRNPAFNDLARYLEKGGLGHTQARNVARTAFEKGWRKPMLEAAESELLRIAKKLPRVNDEIAIVFDPNYPSPVSIVETSSFTEKPKAYTFNINLGSALPPRFNQESAKRAAQHEGLHGVEFDLLITNIGERCYQSQGGIILFDRGVLNRARSAHADAIIKRRGLSTPLSSQRFLEEVERYRKILKSRGGPEDIDLLLAETVVWANCDVEDFKDMLNHYMHIFATSNRGTREPGLLVLFWTIHPIYAAFHVLLLEEYGWKETATPIRELFSRADCPQKNKDNYHMLYNIFKTMWIAAKAEPLPSRF